MFHLRKSLTIILMLFMSMMFAVSNSAVADASGFIVHEQSHEISICDESCAMTSNINCQQHCDHQTVLAIEITKMPVISHISIFNGIYQQHFPTGDSLPELKPPQAHHFSSLGAPSFIIALYQ